MDPVHFRDVEAGDETIFFRLFTAVRTEELGMQDWSPEQRDPILRFQFEAQRRSYRGEASSAAERLVQRDGAPVGWVIVTRSPTEVRCLDLAILSEHRSQGVGTRVLRLLQGEAAAAGCSLALTVMRTNPRALAFYDRLGFRMIGETDLHVVMEWRR